MKNKLSFVSGIVLLLASIVSGFVSGLFTFTPVVGTMLLFVPIVLIICGFFTKGIILPVLLIALELFLFFQYLPLRFFGLV
jgi:hypothetical protein